MHKLTDPPNRAHSPATANELRLIADDMTLIPHLYQSLPHMAGVDGGKLLALADQLEGRLKLESNDVIADLIVALRTSATDGQATILSAEASQKLADALLQEGGDTTERLAKAGFAAAVAERDAQQEQVLRRQIQSALLDTLEEVAKLEDERSQLIAAVNHNADIIDELEDEIAEREQPNIVLVFVDPEIGGFTPAQASNIAMAVLEHMEA